MVYRSVYKFYVNVLSATNQRIVADGCDGSRLFTEFMWTKFNTIFSVWNLRKGQSLRAIFRLAAKFVNVAYKPRITYKPSKSTLFGRDKASIILPWLTPDDFTLAKARVKSPKGQSTLLFYQFTSHMRQSSFQSGLKFFRAITWDFSSRPTRLKISARVAQTWLKLSSCNRELRFLSILSEDRAEISALTEILDVISPASNRE